MTALDPAARERDAARDRFDRYLRSRGLKVTPERREVLDEVFASQDHFDVRGILRRMAARGRTVSRATIYRTVDLLVDAKLLNKLEFGDGEAHYELRHGRPPHEHFYCTRCGRIIEFTSEEVPAIVGRIAREYRFRADSHRFQISGLCSRCVLEGPDALDE